MATVTDYESLNAKIIEVVGVKGDGSDLLLAGTIGRKLSLAGGIDESEFAKTGAHVAAEVGAVMARMVDLGDKVDWSTAVFDWAGGGVYGGGVEGRDGRGGRVVSGNDAHGRCVPILGRARPVC